MANNLQHILSGLDLNGMSVKIYLFLDKKGISSLSKVADGVGISRYKAKISLLDLISKNLVRAVSIGKALGYENTSSDELLNYVSVKRNQIEVMENEVERYIQSLPAISLVSDPLTKIVAFSGREGFKNITLNTCKTKGIFRIFEIDYLGIEFDFEFGEEIRKSFVRNNIEIHQLTNSVEYPFHTEVKEIFETKYWELRYIDKNSLDMKYELAVYNDVFCLYRFESDGEFFGVEIHNAQLAKMQKQIFDFMWLDAKKMKYSGKTESLTLVG